MKTNILFILIVTLTLLSFCYAETKQNKQNPPDCTKPKSKLAVFIISILVGSLGIDRFYTGYIGLGIGKLLISIFSCGLCGWIWWLIDWILIVTDSWDSEFSGCKFNKDF
eukprot:gene8868-817_t